MTEDVRRRCMEPFFTTNPRSVSTGLGLFLVYGIVKKAGGAITLRTKLGRGTEFFITLPAARTPELGKVAACASVRVSDPRLRALVVAELASIEFDVADDPTGCAVLITDEQDHEALLRLAESLPRCRIGLLGPAPAGGAGARIVASGAAPSATAVRQFVRLLAASGHPPR